MPIIITSKFLTKLLSVVISVYAITLFPFIILSEEVDEYTMNHERPKRRQADRQAGRQADRERQTEQM